MLLALLGALVVGLSLGLLGSGGSILTVPVLIFILHRPEKLAIAESLAIVSLVALIGSLPYAKRKLVHWRSVWMFGVSGMIGACAGACFSHLVSGKVQLASFGMIMILASWMMIRGKKVEETTDIKLHAKGLVLAEGFLVGGVTGFMGVGGGFLIVPALVLLLNLPMYLAIGTSLVIIAMNAFTGFIEQLIFLSQTDQEISWSLITIISTVGICGSFTGSFLAKKMPQAQLRRLFGFMLIPLGLYIICHQLELN